MLKLKKSIFFCCTVIAAILSSIHFSYETPIMPLKRILYVASEISPFSETSMVAQCVRTLGEAMQGKQLDVRMIVPKFGTISDRMHRLHEVLRLSDNVVAINQVEYPIVVKVSTIPNTRLQVYFIDNEQLFGDRKSIFHDTSQNFFEDNNIRMLFFCMSVVKTLKKMEWEADIVHCHDWITTFLPFFWKKIYPSDTLFAKAKIVSTIYNHSFSYIFSDLSNKLESMGIATGDIPSINRGTLPDIIQLAIQYSDITFCGEALQETELKKLSDTYRLIHIATDEQYSENYWAAYTTLTS